MTDMKGIRIRETAVALTVIFAIAVLNLSTTVFHTETRLSTHTPPLEVQDLMYDGETDILIGRITSEPLNAENESEEYIEIFPERESESVIWEEPYAKPDISFETDSEETEFLDADYFKFAGVVYDGDTKYTWYSQNVLPGGGLDIPGRHTDMGFVMDEQDRIVVASTDYPPGTEIDLPFGYGKGVVLDTGYLESGQIDVYTDF